MRNLLLSLLLLVGCSNSSSIVEDNFEYHYLGNYQWGFGGHHQYVGKLFVDDCMYIVIEGYNDSGIAHAGNCPNPIHICK